MNARTLLWIALAPATLGCRRPAPALDHGGDLGPAVALRAPTLARTTDGLDTRFDARAAAVVGSGWSWSMQLARFGRAASMRAAKSTTPEQGAERVRYDRGDGVEEWYARTPAGVEQGFTLENAAPGAGSLRLELESEGLHAALAGGRIALRDGAGATRAYYGELHALDARGHELPSSLGVDGGHVVIQVDDSGAAYPVTIDPLVWGVQARLVPGGKTSVGMVNVAASGDLVLLGSLDLGAVAFQRGASSWSQTPLAAASFCGPVAVDGTTAMFYSAAASGTQFSFYSLKGAAWSVLPGPTQPQHFADTRGYSLAIRGGTAIAGAWLTGVVYVFVGSDAGWSYQAQLGAELAGEAGFGDSVAIDGDTAAVYYKHEAPATAAAHVFVRSGTSWSRQTMFSLGAAIPVNPLEGFSLAIVALSGDTLLVGHPYAESAFVYARSGTTWTQQATLKATGASGTNGFGSSVALSGDRALVSAPQKALATGTGAVYVFQRSGTTWSQVTELDNPAGDSSGAFGASLSLGGGTIAVSGQGVGYVYSDSLASVGDACTTDLSCALGTNCIAGKCAIALANGTGCKTNDECNSRFCVDGVCCNSACTGQCAACDLASTRGTCTPVVGAPHGARTPCTGGAGGPCGVVCTGLDVSACAPATAAVACACTGGSLAYCDGAGKCGTPQHCPNNFACSADLTCHTQCTVGADCDNGFRCAAGQCVAGAKCSADHGASIDLTGSIQSCTPYVCTEATGACLRNCQVESDCAKGLTCDAAGQCAAPVAPATSSGGCATIGTLGALGDLGVAGMGGVAAVALVALARRRRRARGRDGGGEGRR